MIQQANKYASARAGECSFSPARSGQPVSPQILIPRLGKEIRFDEWYWKELREGGILQRYMAREKWNTTKRYRAVAKSVHEFKQNNKSDLRRTMDIPARDYYRWKAVDKHFWEDRANLKSLKRDNPDAKIYV